MEPNLTSYEELRARIIPLSFDPYLLSESELQKIADIEKNLFTARQNGEFDSALESLFETSLQSVMCEKKRIKELETTVRVRFTLLYERLTKLLSNFLSPDSFRKFDTMWFSFLSEEERLSLGHEAVTLLLQCDPIEHSLIDLTRECKKSEPFFEYQKDTLIIRLAVLLTEQYPLNTYTTWNSTVAEHTREILSVQASLRNYCDISLKIALTLLPAFREAIHPFLSFLEDGSPILKNTSEVQRLFREVQAFRERVRQTVSPLLKT